MIASMYNIDSLPEFDSRDPNVHMTFKALVADPPRFFLHATDEWMHAIYRRVCFFNQIVPELPPDEAG